MKSYEDYLSPAEFRAARRLGYDKIFSDIQAELERLDKYDLQLLELIHGLGGEIEDLKDCIAKLKETRKPC